MNVTITMPQASFTIAQEKAKKHPLYKSFDVELKELDGFTNTVTGVTYVSATFKTKSQNRAKNIDVFDNLGYLDNLKEWARIECDNHTLEN